MAKLFTYSRLPEHQVAIYHDENDKIGKPSGWNIAEFWLTIFSNLLLLIICPISIFFCLKVIRDYEKIVVFRLGRLLPPKGPGVVFINPCIDVWTRVDTRARAFSVPPQQIHTRDGGCASVGAEVQFSVKDPVLSRAAVQDLNHSLRMLAQTALVNSLVTRKLAEVQHDRKFINKRVQDMISQSAACWGVEINKIEMSDVRVLKEADEAVNVISSLFGGGSQSSVLGNTTITDPRMLNLFSALGAGSMPATPTLPQTSNSFTQPSSLETGSNLLTPEQLVKLISGALNENLVQEIGGTFQFNVLGQGGGTWYLDLKNGRGKISAELPAETPDVVLTMSVQEMQRILYEQTTAFDAYMQGTLKVEGDLRMAMNLETIVKKLKETPLTNSNQGTQIPGVYIV